MSAFSAYDGTEPACRVVGEGPPLVCPPGGPMQDSVCLGDVGGLSAHRRLIMPDLRGTGCSAVPEDPASYRCDRPIDDMKALREHLGLDRLDLLGHSAGTNLAVPYAARHPERVGPLALITPSVLAVGITVTGDVRVGTARLRRDEPRFPEAFAALEALVACRAAPTLSGPSPLSGTAVGPPPPAPTGPRRTGSATRRPRPSSPPRAPSTGRRPGGARPSRLTGPRTGQGGRPQLPAARDGRVPGAVPAHRAGRPAARRTLPVARRRAAVRGDHRSVPEPANHRHPEWRPH